jgi:hypothetical protein
MIFGTEALRRQATAEFPDTTVGGFMDRAREWGPGGGSAEKPAAPAEDSKVDQVERLTALKQQGALSEAEFEAAKAEVLGSK